jgi:hypothetical protein
MWMFASIRAQRSRRAKGGLEDRVGNSIVTGGDSSGNYNGDQNPRHRVGKTPSSPLRMTQSILPPDKFSVI